MTTERRIKETKHFTTEQAAGYPVPGYLIVQHRGGKHELSELDDEELADLTRELRGAEALVRELIAPERIYVAKFAELNPVIHFHVIPRTERIGRAFSEATGGQPPYNGAQLIAWLWEHAASLGYTEEELASFIERARRWFGE